MKNYEERSFGVFLPFYAAEYQLKKKSHSYFKTSHTAQKGYSELSI